MKQWTREIVEAKFREAIGPVIVPLPVDSPGTANIVAALQAGIGLTLDLIRAAVEEARREEQRKVDTGMKILDMSAGNRAVWFDKAYRDAVYLDIRPEVICHCLGVEPYKCVVELIAEAFVDAECAGHEYGKDDRHQQIDWATAHAACVASILKEIFGE